MGGKRDGAGATNQTPRDFALKPLKL